LSMYTVTEPLLLYRNDLLSSGNVPIMPPPTSYGCPMLKRLCPANI
jgi:hypothetical protein